MEQGQFFFLSSQYYKDFPDPNLMQNKRTSTGEAFNRPFFFAFLDHENPDIFWAVPVSSKEEKFRKIYDAKVRQYGVCNTICFGRLITTNAAFLIQNMCPVTKKYIAEEYKDSKGNFIRVDDRVASEVIRNAKKVLAIEKRGTRIIFPDVYAIYKELSTQLAQDRWNERKIAKKPTLAARIADAKTEPPKAALENVVNLDKQSRDNNAAMRKVMDFMTEGMER